MFFYALHEFVMPTYGGDNGKRNCATFLVGVFLYAALYVVIHSWSLRFQRGAFDGLVSALVVVAVADAAVMAWTYKNHYGRNITCEMDAGDDPRDWIYDAATHRYRRPTDVERFAKELRAQRELAAAAATAVREEAAAIAAVEAGRIADRKRRSAAARVLQRWYRGRLYAPPDGALYLRAMRRFEECNKIPAPEVNGDASLPPEA